MSFATYLKGALGDFVLTACIGISLSYVLLCGFYVDESIRTGIVPALIGLVEIAALIAILYTRKTRLMGGIAIGIVLVVSWGIGAAMTPVGTVFVDYEQNYLIAALVMTLSPLACFLGGRTRTGSALMFIVVTFLHVFIQFFYNFELIGFCLLSTLACLALIMYKNYQMSARTATSMRTFSFAPGFATAVIASLVCVGIGAGAWFGILQFVAPDAANIKLITEYRALENKPVVGTSDEFLTPNTDLTSDVTNDQNRTTDDLQIDDENGIPYPANGQSDSDNEIKQQSGSFLGIDLDSMQDTFNLISYQQIVMYTFLIILLIAALIAAFFFIRRFLRRKRLEGIRQGSPEEQIVAIYKFLMGKFERIGLGVPAGLTTIEFSHDFGQSMGRFTSRDGATFDELTGIYNKVAYGKQPATQEQADLFASFYGDFWKNAREYLGNFKYFRKSFRLG